MKPDAFLPEVNCVRHSIFFLLTLLLGRQNQSLNISIFETTAPLYNMRA